MSPPPPCTLSLLLPFPSAIYLSPFPPPFSSSLPRCKEPGKLPLPRASVHSSPRSSSATFCVPLSHLNTLTQPFRNKPVPIQCHPRYSKAELYSQSRTIAGNWDITLCYCAETALPLKKKKMMDWTSRAHTPLSLWPDPSPTKAERERVYIRVLLSAWSREIPLIHS